MCLSLGGPDTENKIAFFIISYICIHMLTRRCCRQINLNLIDIYAVYVTGFFFQNTVSGVGMGDGYGV